MEVDTNMAAMVTPRDKAQGLSKQDAEGETRKAALGQLAQSPQVQDKDLTKPTKKGKGTSTSLQQAVLAEPKHTEQVATHTNALAEQEETEDTRQQTQDAPLLPNQVENQGQEDTRKVLANPTTTVPLLIEADGITYTPVWLQRYPQSHKHRVATAMKWDDIDRKTKHVMRVLAQHLRWNESEMQLKVNDVAVWMNFIESMFTKTCLQMLTMNQVDYEKTLHFLTRLAKTPPTALMHVLSLPEGHTDGHLLNPAFLANTVYFAAHNILGRPWKQSQANIVDTQTLASNDSSFAPFYVAPHLRNQQRANTASPVAPQPQGPQLRARAAEPPPLNVSYIRIHMDAPVAQSRDSDTKWQKNLKQVGICKKVLNMCNRSARDAQQGSQILSLREVNGQLMILTQPEIDQIEERGMSLWLANFKVGIHNYHRRIHCMLKVRHPGPVDPILTALRNSLTREFPTNNGEVDESPIPSVIWERIGWFPGSVTRGQNNQDFKAAVVKAIEAHPHLRMRPFALDNMAITRGPMERDPETGRWLEPPDDVFFGTAVTVQCSPEDREEVIHIFQTVFDPRVPLKDVPHFVTWSFMQDIHEENAEATQDLRDSWVEAVKDHFQLAHHPAKGEKDTRQAYRTWTTTELMDLDTPNPHCDGATLRWLLMTMTHKDIKGQPVIRQAAHMVTDRSKVVLTCLTEHYDLMRECMGALPLVMLGFWKQPWGFFVPGTERKMQMKYDFVNGEWKRRGAISYSATKRTRVEHNDQTLDLIERHLSKEVDDSQPVFSFTNIELVLNTAVARGQEAQANNNQGTLGSEQSGQTTRNDGTLQADSEATTQTRTRRRRR